MKDKIVLTSNMASFVSTVEALINKPERMDRMGLIWGKWGLGKTTTLQWFFTNNLCYRARSMAAWARSPNMMIEDILKGYRVEAKGRLKQDIRELVRVAKKNRHPLFIDEADRVVRKSFLIETIRDIHDLARIPIILIGQENIIDILQRKDLGQVFSRITEVAEFRELRAQDIQRISKELCEFECDFKVATFIRNVTLGDFRLVNAVLSKAEKYCEFNKATKISMTIAKEASMTLPHPDDLNRVIEMDEKEFPKQVVVAG
ncbi:AAA family ATPase [Thermodesulfobacteriota bacterium]